MELEINKEKLGALIKGCRKARRLTQAELAEAVDLNEKQISRIEAGENYPTLVTFLKLVIILDIDIESFNNNMPVKTDTMQEEAIAIIKNSSKEELKIYLDFLKLMRKNLKNFRIK